MAKIKKFDGIAKAWLPLAAAIVIVSGLVYTAVQQDLRQSANDPQIQLAEDGATSLNAGASPSSVTSGPVGSATSLAPFVMVFDSNGQPTAPADPTVTPPSGVFGYTKAHGQDRITWQAANGARYATIVEPFSGHGGGYVLAARSLKEVERRENQALWEAVGFGVIALGASLFLALALN